MSSEITATKARLIVPISDRDHTQGPADALATLVEYGDYPWDPEMGLLKPDVVAPGQGSISTAWYDNEAGFCNQMLHFAQYMGSKL